MDSNGQPRFLLAFSTSKVPAKRKPLVLLKAGRALANFSRRVVEKDRCCDLGARAARVTARRCVTRRSDVGSVSVVDQTGLRRSGSPRAISRRRATRVRSRMFPQRIENETDRRPARCEAPLVDLQSLDLRLQRRRRLGDAADRLAGARMGPVPPTRSNSRSFRTRSRMIWVSAGSSPTSSRKSEGSDGRPMTLLDDLVRA